MNPLGKVAARARPSRARPSRASAGALAGVLALAGLAGCSDDTTGGDSGRLTVFAAASLQGAFTELAEVFAQAHPEVTVAPVVFDGSSTLATQLEEGAEADVFASADETTMGRITAAGLDAADAALFATNTLVIAVPQGNPRGVAALSDLIGLDVVVCSVEVPCGRAAGALLDVAGETLTPVSLEQNVTAVAERVVSGEVDAGLVYATDVVARQDELDAVVPAQAADVVSSYPIVALDASEVGQQFVDLVLSAEGRDVLTRYGFGTP